jgi:hypothetical protein
MKFSAHVCMASIALSALTMPVSSAIAADAGKATRTILAEDEKFQVFEIRQKPGEVNTPSTSGHRVIRALSGGTLLRTYADGKTERSDWKTGEVQIQGPGPQYTVTNVGSTEVVLYVVQPK